MLLAGTPSFGYGSAGTPGLDQRTPGTVDAYSPAFGQGAATPNTGLTPAFADSGEHLLLQFCRSPSPSKPLS